MPQMELIFGTGNKAKVAQVQGALDPLEITVRGINELGIDLDVPENGTTAQANARVKATSYAQAAGRAVFSMDNALYLHGLSDADQPGLNVRRIPGATGRPTDQEMLDYYRRLIEQHGGKMEGHWEFAVAIASPQGDFAETTIRSPRQFTAQPSNRVVEGYPLESIQVDPVSGKHIADMTEEEQAVFWQRVIGAPLMKFVRNHIAMLSE